MMRAIEVQQLQEAMDNDVLLLDMRGAQDFRDGFIVNALFMGEGEKWMSNVQHFINKDKKVAVVLKNDADAEAAEASLLRAGIKHIMGYLRGGIESWRAAGKPMDMIIEIEADELLMDLPHDKKLEVIDVRNADNYSLAHVKGATNKPLAVLADIAELSDIDEEHNLYIHCGGGNSALIAASLLKREGYEKIRLVAGGFGAIAEVPGMPIVEDKTKLN